MTPASATRRNGEFTAEQQSDLVAALVEHEQTMCSCCHCKPCLALRRLRAALASPTLAPTTAQVIPSNYVCTKCGQYWAEHGGVCKRCMRGLNSQSAAAPWKAGDTIRFKSTHRAVTVIEVGAGSHTKVNWDDGGRPMVVHNTHLERLPAAPNREGE